LFQQRLCLLVEDPEDIAIGPVGLDRQRWALRLFVLTLAMSVSIFGAILGTWLPRL